MPVYTKGDQKILYVHVPKTAGTSIQGVFKDNEYVESFFSPNELYHGLCTPQHIHAKLIRKEFDLSEFTYIFSVYRDPVERLISEYTWRCSKGGQRYPSFKYWVELIFDMYEQNNYVNDNHIRPQCEFYFESCKVFDFNNITELGSKLSNDIGLNSSQELSKTNSSKYEYTLTEKCESLIKEFYKKDYEWRENNVLH